MILRQFCARQSRQLRALNRTPRIPARFSSTQAPPAKPAEENLRSEPESQTESVSLLVNVKEEDKQASRTAWRSLEERTRQFDTHGTASPPAYDPDDVVKNPPRATEVSLEMLLAAQTHLGHSTSRWNPQNSRYIFGVRDGIHIISLDQTAAYMRRAARVVEEVAARGGLVLFAGTRAGHKDAVVRAAELAGGYHVFERWVAGTLTNSYQILGHCERRVVNAFDEEIPQLKRTLEDRLPLQPDLVVCLNPGDNEALLHECALNTIPTIGVLDTDFDATRLTYQIPANDDSLRSTALIACVLGRAGEEGQRRRLAHAQQGQFTYAPVKAEDLLTHPFTGEKL